MIKTGRKKKEVPIFITFIIADIAAGGRPISGWFPSWTSGNLLFRTNIVTPTTMELF